METLIIGGDERFVYLKQTLIENNFYVKDLYLNSSYELNEDLNNFKIIFLPIPFSKNGLLNSPLHDEKIPLIQILTYIKNFKGKVIGGFSKTDEELLQKLNLDFINILSDEEFTLINAIITAEGTIQKIINENEKSLFESNVCITGYGRVSKALSKRLYPLCNELIVYNNPSINYIYTKVDNIKSRTLNKFYTEAKYFDVIINTIPTLILDKKVLDSINPNKTLILDLASLPGGVDFSYAKNIGIKTFHYLGVPAKISSKSASNAIFNFVKKIINN